MSSLIGAIPLVEGRRNPMSNFNEDISNWDTSGVTDMTAMFDRATAFNQPLTFDTSKVTSMKSMFYIATAFNGPLTFDTSSVTDMSTMFAIQGRCDGRDIRCTPTGATARGSFNQPITFNTSSVKDMHYMFQGATKFNQPLSFDTSEVTSMSAMFYGGSGHGSAFNQPLSFDTSKVTVMTNMFYATPVSAANKLIIRCAWAGTPVFASAGYGSNWAPGSCTSG